jgi:hypothetical protein
MFSIFTIASNPVDLVVVSIASLGIYPLRISPTHKLAKLVWGAFLDFSITLGGFLKFYVTLDAINIPLLSLRLCMKKKKI